MTMLKWLSVVGLMFGERPALEIVPPSLSRQRVDNSTGRDRVWPHEFDRGCLRAQVEGGHQ